MIVLHQRTKKEGHTMTQTQESNQQPTFVTPVMVALSDMITLDKSYLYQDELIARATRPYDEKYAKTLSDRLSQIPVTHWTPLEGIETDEGIVIIDGQHRYNAAQMREYPISTTNLEHTEKPDALPVKIHQFSTNESVATRAYKANMEHGKAYDTGTRTAYAVTLYHRLEKVRGEKPSEREVARDAGISHVALNAALKKEAKKQVQEGDSEVSEDTANKVLVDDTKKLVKHLISFHNDTILSYETDSEAIAALSKALLSFDTDREIAAKMCDVLMKAIKLAGKEAEKQAKKQVTEATTSPAKKTKKGKGDTLTQTTLEQQIADSEHSPA